MINSKNVKVILFNGPPSSGKDFAANFVKNNFDGVRTDKFARILKNRTHSLYGFHWREWDYYEDCKEVPNDDFFGLTPRQAYIKVSETYFKPIHGKRIFGEMLLRDIKDRKFDVLVISDSGFVEEAEVLMEEYGTENIMLVRVIREGHDFSSDSRSYLELPGAQINVTMVNEGTADFTDRLYDLVFQFLNKESVSFGINEVAAINTPGFKVLVNKQPDPFFSITVDETEMKEEARESQDKAFLPPIASGTFPDEPTGEDSDIQKKDYVFEDVIDDEPSLLKRLGRLVGIR